MRKFLPRVIFLTILLVVLGGVFMLFLSQARPFRPGNTLFPVQYLAERQRAGFSLNALNRAYFELFLLERRMDDLAVQTGTSREIATLQFLDLALDQTSQAVSRVAPSNPAWADVRTRLFLMVQHLQTLLPTLQIAPQEDAELVQALEAKVATLIDTLNSDSIALTPPINTDGASSTGATNPQNSPTPTTVPSLSGQGIPFPPGSEGAEHLFYPLVGAHAVIKCAACHPGEQYAGTPTTCVACHQDVLPVNHFVGDCATCHTPISWQDATFDHALYGATDCLACHTLDKPVNHFAGQCSACHSTTAWTPASFDHSLVDTSNCQSCHSGDAPANHYTGQCSACHNTSNWADVSFDHTGQMNCAACHSDDTPANHYAGQCSNCHNTQNWADASFDHTGQTDCVACHTPPPNHYAGQCSQCHTTNTWNFNHNSNTDCLACHANDEPDEDDHPNGQQCSDCHNTTDWDDADDDGGSDGDDDD
ncbi:MAG: hypothetical protein Fur0022_33280 [Anaerolineales bacterium]